MTTDPNETFRQGTYDPGMLGFWDRVLEAFYRRLPTHAPGTKLLDVGAGRGLLVSLARRDGLDPYGIEPYWPQPIDDHVVRAFAEDLPFPDASFDLVTSFSVIEYLVDPRQALTEVARVLTPTGRAVIAVPELAATRGLRRGRYRHITSSAWFRAVVAQVPALTITDVRGFGLRYLVPIGKRTIGRVLPSAAPSLLAALYVREVPRSIADLAIFTLRR